VHAGAMMATSTPNPPKGRHMSIFILMAGALIIGGWLMQKD